MKVLDLQCPQGHVFEGWFSSEEDFQSQKHRGLVQCPICADDHVQKRLSAPRLNLGAREPSALGGEVSAASPATLQAFASAGEASVLAPALQAAWLQLARKVVENTEDVGERFAEEARRMHHGETQERGIRGRATADEAMQLLDEGIAVMPLPLPVAAKETLQ